MMMVMTMMMLLVMLTVTVMMMMLMINGWIDGFDPPRGGGGTPQGNDRFIMSSLYKKQIFLGS